MTEYPTAWFRYFNNALIDAGLNPATEFNEAIAGNIVHIDIKAVKYFDLGYALIETDLEV
jgi:hypothetical protein